MLLEDWSTRHEQQRTGFSDDLPADRPSRGSSPAGVPIATHRLHGGADRLRPGQIRQSVDRLARLPGTVRRPAHPRHSATGDVRRRRDRDPGRAPRGGPAEVRCGGGDRLAGRDHRQPADPGRLLRRRAARLRPARRRSRTVAAGQPPADRPGPNPKVDLLPHD